jgi:NAD(P)-dependent dehydrogenase (short-subunit alcohol dehydrogenase family)
MVFTNERLDFCQWRPAGRYAAAAFLASAPASYITGTMPRADGGLVPTVY